MMAGPATMGSKLDTTCSNGWAYLAPNATAVYNTVQVLLHDGAITVLLT